MGVNCNIIITWASDVSVHFDPSEKIKEYLKISSQHSSSIEPIGNRAWEPEDTDCEIVCMKDWFEEECQKFFEFLGTLPWNFYRDTVQIYYRPADFRNNPFIYRNLDTTKNIQHKYSYVYYFETPDEYTEALKIIKQHSPPVFIDIEHTGEIHVACYFYDQLIACMFNLGRLKERTALKQ